MLEFKSQAQLSLQNQAVLYPVDMHLKDRLKQARRANKPKLTQAAVAAELGVTPQAVSGWERGVDKPESDKLVDLARILGADVGWLLGEAGAQLTITKGLTQGSQKPHIQPESLVHNARFGEQVSGFTRVPIRGRTMGGKDGALIFTAEEHYGDVEAPSKLSGVPDAYAVYVIGDSMLDRYQHGEVVFVHPYAPYKKGDYVAIQIKMDDHGTVHGWVKRFVSMDNRVLKVEQLNPKKVLTFPRSRVSAVHKIVFSGEA